MATEQATTSANEARVKCPYCHTRFSTRERLVTHSRQAHDKTPPPPHLVRAGLIAVAVLVLVIVAAVAWRILTG